MDLKTKIQEYENRLIDASSKEEADQYLSLLKTAAEVHKLKSEADKAIAEEKKINKEVDNISYTRKTDWIRFAGLLAPMITSVILIITLIIQTNQTKETRNAQKQEKEDEKWKLLTDKLSAPDAAVNQTIPVLIKDFFKSEKYKNTAIELSTNYLAVVKNEDTFQSLFKEYSKNIDRNNYSYLVRLTRKLFNQYQASDNQRKSDSSILVSFTVSPLKSKLTGNIKFYEQRITEASEAGRAASNELNTASKALAQFVKQFTKNASDQNSGDATLLDLSEAYFYLTNLDSVKFQGVIMRGTTFDLVTFAHATLTGVKEFENSLWGRSSWWLAKEISPDLLQHLKKFQYYNRSDLPQPANGAELYKSWMTTGKVKVQ